MNEVGNGSCSRDHSRDVTQQGNEDGHSGWLSFDHSRCAVKWIPMVIDHLLKDGDHHVTENG